MKKLTQLACLLTLSTGLLAQLPTKPKSDVILKINGDELTGRVTETGDNEIKFIYAGETLVYSIKKSDILKITFASGRIEFFNKPTNTLEETVTKNGATLNDKPVTSIYAEDHHNKVAILPFGYIKNSESAGDEMGYKAQNDTYAFLNKHSTGLTITDPRTTNALLIKSGIDRYNLMGYTMDELCNVLGVEYVIDGTITQNLSNTNSSTSGYHSKSGSGRDSDDKKKSSGYGYSTTTSRTNYQTSVSLNIYTDQNTSIYSENRKALLNQNEGAYNSPLEYLLKRCPLYRK